MKTVLFPFLLTSKIFVLCTEAAHCFVFIDLPVLLLIFLSYSLPITLSIMKLSFFCTNTHHFAMTNTEPNLRSVNILLFQFTDIFLVLLVKFFCSNCLKAESLLFSPCVVLAGIYSIPYLLLLTVGCLYL